ncbi:MULTISPECIES: hypothetical protein [unclassified Bradyrhizobium]|uniref:hypothetical protein n=1 Tax=unclassified Bradyrhizobium TaxID=2631580 RepID=UPI001BA71497|nr:MULTISPECIES: hypothetical protein [unclassified Bradyrhizobium]MBR1223966.1 hypothetical protein [Bradyrhizobium sp. AUGA SZCCT0176]MBR1298394.1 hypothetical protein [Bradyrhizobium sp. AUGA SZCCT0042]
MDDAFYKDRARHIRQLANEADPFIKKRLLRLASNYDAMTTPFARGPAPSNVTEGPEDNLAETGKGHGE